MLYSSDKSCSRIHVNARSVSWPLLIVRWIEPHSVLSQWHAVLSVRFEVGVSLLLAPVRADKRGLGAPFSSSGKCRNTAGDSQEYPPELRREPGLTESTGHIIATARKTSTLSKAKTEMFGTRILNTHFLILSNFWFNALRTWIFWKALICGTGTEITMAFLPDTSISWKRIILVPRYR